MNFTKSNFIDKTTPILVIESFFKRGNERPKLNFSGIGFLYRKNIDGTYLCVTCGHFFWSEIFNVPEGSDLFITKDYGTNKPEQQENFLPFIIVDGPKFAKNINHDIAIFTVRPHSEPEEEFNLFNLTSTPEEIKEDEAISLVYVNEHSLITLIHQENFKKLSFCKYNFKSTQAALAPKNSNDALRLRNLGACEYPCYEIFSDFGASGSPICTQDGRLLGMNLGGQSGVWTATVTPQQIKLVIDELGL